MKEDIEILEEIVEIYYDCAGNKEKDYDMRVDMGFMKKETQALENLINRVKELELKLQEKICFEGHQQFKELQENSIPKTKIREKIEEYQNQSLTVCLGGRSQGKTFKQAVQCEIIKALQELLGG